MVAGVVQRRRYVRTALVVVVRKVRLEVVQLGQAGKLENARGRPFQHGRGLFGHLVCFGDAPSSARDAHGDTDGLELVQHTAVEEQAVSGQPWGSGQAADRQL